MRGHSQRPDGVVAVVAPVAPKARHGIDDNTSPLVVGKRARPVGLARGPQDGDSDPGATYCPEFLDDGFPAGDIGGKNIPLTKAERHDRPAPRRPDPRRPDHQPGEGAGRERCGLLRAAYGTDGVVALGTARLIFACRLHQPCYRCGP